jgi:hypothetical protein
LTTGNTWYWSGILNVSDISRLNTTATGPGDVGVLLAGFNNAIGPSTGSITTFDAHLRISKNANNSNQYFIGAGVTNGGTTFALTAPQNDGDTVFVVESYSKNAGANQDQVKVWLNPDASTFGGAEPAATLTVNYVTGTQITPASFVLRNSAPATTGGTPTILFDELRIGTMWADVTPTVVPEPATFALAGLAALAVLTLRRRS